ncbi:MAG: radical SAM protein [Planctomycetes bacterium]|nr:radical SAM protein [Planctomycetota bacterium]
MELSHLPVSRELAANERLRVSIELTNICNFSCPFCPQAYKHEALAPAGAPYNRRQGMMAPELFERAVAECNRAADTVELGFFGEQTLHKRYVEFLRALQTRRFALELNTNLSFVTHEIMQAWIDARVDLVRLSLDAVTPEVFNRARPGQVRDLSGRVVAERDRMRAINEKVAHWLALPDHRPTRLVFVKSSHNTGDEKRKFVEHWTPRLAAKDYVLAKQVLSYGGKTADPLVLPHRCNVWEMRFLMIDWRGVLSPCNLDTNMDLAFGSLLEDSLTGAYFGARAAALRQRTGCGKDLTPCRTCVDGNNWTRNETFANPLLAAPAISPSRHVPSSAASLP